jgi:hypothetical protein
MKLKIGQEKLKKIINIAAVVVVALCAISFGVLIERQLNMLPFLSKVLGISTSPTIVLPTEAPTPTEEAEEWPTEIPVYEQVQQPAQSNTNTNTVDCVGPDGKHFKTTQQECDNFNKAWSKPANNAAKNTQLNAQNSSSYPTYAQVKVYPPCTITYHYSTGEVSSTYTHLSPEECVSTQSELNSKAYKPAPTAQPIPTSDSVPYNPPYNPNTQKCSAYGGSAREACLQIYGN